MDKQTIYGTIANEEKRAEMIMKMNKMLWYILFSNQKCNVSGELHDIGHLALLQNVQPWKSFNFSVASALISSELVSY